MKNIALIGFMGTGKTSVGIKLADMLEWSFVDTDKLIEEKMGMPIPDIFEKFDEKRFRFEEKLAVEGVSNNTNQVISTGGGVVLNKDNVVCLKQSALLICLKANPQTILERVGHDSSRPLLAGENPLKIIINLLKLREPYYQCADLYLDTSEMTVQEAANEILYQLQKWGVSDVRCNKGQS